MRRHGTYAAYSSGCKCDLCKEANATYHRRRRHAIGATERSTRVSNRRRSLAADWVRDNQPDVWLELRDVADRQIRKEDRP